MSSRGPGDWDDQERAADVPKDALRKGVERLEREWRETMNYFHADALRALLAADGTGSGEPAKCPTCGSDDPARCYWPDDMPRCTDTFHSGEPR